MYYASGIDYKNTMNNAYRLCVLFNINKEREEERQRAKAADKRMERFERGFKGQFMYER